MRQPRRELRRLMLALAVSGLAAAGVAVAQDTPADSGWLHATSLVGTPKYPEGFAHFDYVNPDAPKGGRVRLAGVQTTFDTLNPVLPKGVLADGIGLVFESLMTSALDEFDNSTQYGLLADAFRYPADYSWVTYRLNPDARWHDGKPVTAEDVVWSFNKLKELNPSQAFYYQHVVSAEATGEREVTFTFDETGNRELPHIVGQVIVLPKHWWEAEGRDIASGTLEPPMGSGPYRVSAVSPARSISYERVPDYWGAELNVNVGQNNFDTVHYEYYRDQTVKFEAFKADDFDFWSENEAKRWETGYDFPAFAQGRVKREWVELDQVTGRMIGLFPNLRRDMFKDVRVRRALNYAFDFEDMNRTLFYGQYTRIDSFFWGIELRSSGLPEGRELEFLEEVRDLVPPEVFTTEYKNPVGGDQSLLRENLRRAVQLLQEAGFRLEGSTMLQPNGQPFAFELLLNGPVLERVALSYQTALARIGIDMGVRPVDSAQYEARVNSRDFDMIYSAIGQSTSPGNEQLEYWGSEAADRDSSRNYIGIKDPAVDALIRNIIFAADRDDLVAATRALDRVLLANQYVIPSYTLNASRIAYWDRFGHPEPYPRFTTGFPTIWWYDQAKADAVGGRQ